MNLVEIVINFKRHLKVLQLLRDKPSTDEIGDHQRDAERGQQGGCDLGGRLNLAGSNRRHQERSQRHHGNEDTRSHGLMLAENIV